MLTQLVWTEIRLISAEALPSWLPVQHNHHRNERTKHRSEVPVRVQDQQPDCDDARDVARDGYEPRHARVEQVRTASPPSISQARDGCEASTH
jgi:hypothetical protein